MEGGGAKIELSDGYLKTLHPKSYRNSHIYTLLAIQHVDSQYSGEVLEIQLYRDAVK